MLEAMVKAQKDRCPVPATVLAKVLGTINAGVKALGPISRVLVRSAYSALSSAVQPYNQAIGSYSVPDWSQHINLSKEVALELGLLGNLLHEINGQPILTSKSGINLSSILEEISNESNQIITSEEIARTGPNPRSGPLRRSFKGQTF